MNEKKLRDLLRDDIIEKYRQANIELFEDIKIALIDDFITKRNISSSKIDLDKTLEIINCLLIDGKALENCINIKINCDIQGFVKFFSNILSELINLEIWNEK